jgi:hypothetical protein
MDNIIKKLLREEVGRMESAPQRTAPHIDAKYLKNEADDENGEKEEKKKIANDSSMKARYDKIKNLLNNPIFNHAEIAKALWGDKDATNRSLFRKKLHMELNDSGDPYEFDDEELSKIGSVLRDTSKQITKTVGRKGS